MELDQCFRQIRLAVFDFDGVFTDNRVFVLEDGREAVACNRSDGLGLELCKKAGFDMLVLSKERNPVVGARCRKLGLECIQGCEDKGTRLRQEVAGRGLVMAQVAYLGNDINDLPCLEQVGLPACVADAYPEVIERCVYITRRAGGHGAVREFCDRWRAANSA
ncbi:MAG TPA: 3-deoxy-D-manno-octulosonate 8-phosphate phosphatase [Gammaproteobacteria bacterium]|nr:3-deoxy-D-manno-octulosonate 8-phosphate phosphatase [Gammaproteobacteria bacterium]